MFIGLTTCMGKRTWLVISTVLSKVTDHVTEGTGSHVQVCRF